LTEASSQEPVVQPLRTTAIMLDARLSPRAAAVKGWTAAPLAA
jgi:hypothetical protein